MGWLGLRSRLVLLVLLALFPVFGLFAYSAARNQEVVLAHAQAMLQAEALLAAVNVAATLPAGFAETQVADGLNPTTMTFAPDGRIFIWQKTGVVRIFKNGVLLTTPFIDIHLKVNSFGDRGLLGVALDPNFSTNGFVYLLYTFESGSNQNGSNDVAYHECLLLLTVTLENGGCAVGLHQHDR